MMDYVKIRQIAHTMGLHVHTVEDLLNKGWTYEEKLNEPRRWIGPESQIRSAL
jgi:hypothetical protein